MKWGPFSTHKHPPPLLGYAFAKLQTDYSSRPFNSKTTHHKEWLTQIMSGVRDTVLLNFKAILCNSSISVNNFPQSPLSCLLQSPDEVKRTVGFGERTHFAHWLMENLWLSGTLPDVYLFFFFFLGKCKLKSLYLWEISTYRTVNSDQINECTMKPMLVRIDSGRTGLQISPERKAARPIQSTGDCRLCYKVSLCCLW